jgi:hypothetical protein
MKKSLIAFAFVLGLTTLQATSTVSPKIKLKNLVEVSDCRYGQCSATAKSTGARCKHCVSKSGDLYCWQHK